MHLKKTIHQHLDTAGETQKAAKWLAFVDDSSEADRWHRLSAHEGLDRDGKKTCCPALAGFPQKNAHVIRV